MVTVLIDDRRAFVDEREAVVLRTPQEGLDWLLANKNTYIDELWLDHDMGWHGTIKPVWQELERAAFFDEPYSIGIIKIVTANPGAARDMHRSLTARGYHAVQYNSDWEGDTMDFEILETFKSR